MEQDKIYHMDCLEGMKQIADRSVDAVIADLPYGVLNRQNGAARWDQKIPLAPLWEQYLRITKPDSPIILFAQGMFTAELVLSQPKLWRYNLVWHKDRVSGHLNANRMPMRQHEDIVVFYRKLPVYHPQMTPCPPEKRNHDRRKTEGFTNRCYGGMKLAPVRIADDKYPTSVVSVPKEHCTGAFYHPTQKPVALIEYLIRTYTDEGDLVLDNCIGSGTTAIAALRTGRHYIGFEIDKSYCEIAEQRIREEGEQREENRTEPQAQSHGGEETATVGQENPSASADQSNENGWDGLLRSVGLDGLGEITGNLGYIMAMLPDILLGAFTGKTQSLRLKDNLLPMASIVAGLFVRNPLLKMLLIGLGGANLLNKAGHEALERKQSEGLTAGNRETEYKRYPDEPLNPRIVNPVLQGCTLVATIDHVPCTVQLSPVVADAYRKGALPLNTLANAVLAQSDRMNQMASQNYDNNRPETIVRTRGIQ